MLESTTTKARLSSSPTAGPFDPSQETLHSHLLFSLRDMYPYQSYYRAVISGLMEPERAFTDARRIIAASARTYLALRDLQLDSYERGIAGLELALEDWANHPPAVRLLTKALAAAGRPPAEIIDACYRALALYPVFLTELPPFAVAAHAALDEGGAITDLVRKWAYFMTRVEWADDDDHPIPDETWNAVMPYLDDLPNQLEWEIKTRYLERTTSLD